MNILILSDLHFEFHADRGRSFASKLPVGEADVIIVAGDLTNSSGLSSAMDLLAPMTKDLVYVLGNHEFYHSNPKKVLAQMKKISAEHPNLHWLEDSAVTIQGQRFVGATLWFADSPSSVHFRKDMNDFQHIDKFVPWVFTKSNKSVHYLQKTINPGDIVVTHHLPTFRSVPPDYKNHPLNAFFVCDMEPVIRRIQPKMWIHGHTHTSTDFQIGSCRVLSNPLGYAGMGINPQFDNYKIIEQK